MATKIAKYSCFFLIVMSQTAMAETYKWEQAVTLRGKITLENFYDSPNYGETPEMDKKVELPILYTESPFDVEGISYDIYSRINNQHKVQLVTHNKLLKYVKCVKVTGTLFEAVSGSTDLKKKDGFGNYEKGDNVHFDQLVGKLDEAKKDAKIIFDQAEATGTDNPTTKMHEFVKYLEGIVAEAKSKTKK